ncbi:hypothetical protein GHT06_015356 [Daphnia sinensis]|uniref:Uncharacterized protein n=1 Tax=Daphnia sinensis TaxID=1820382 RepID=A0AAD5PUK1_9CRUS|nr:hypothetical protein GHT06_015356 [Daphnia sinensis]
MCGIRTAGQLLHKRTLSLAEVSNLLGEKGLSAVCAVSRVERALVTLKLKRFENVNSQLVTFTQPRDKQLSVSLAADMDNEALDGNISASPATPENRSDLPGPPTLTHIPLEAALFILLAFGHACFFLIYFSNQASHRSYGLNVCPTFLQHYRH